MAVGSFYSVPEDGGHSHAPMDDALDAAVEDPVVLGGMTDGPRVIFEVVANDPANNKKLHYNFDHSGVFLPDQHTTVRRVGPRATRSFGRARVL